MYSMAKRFITHSTDFVRVIHSAGRKQDMNIENGHILVSIGGGIGDLLILAEPLCTLVKYYEKAGKKVCLCGRSANKKVLDFLLPANMTQIPFVELDHVSEDIKKIREVFHSFETLEFEEIITFDSSISWASLCLVTALKCNRSWRTFHRKDTAYLPEWVKERLSGCYTHKFMVPLDMNEFQRNLFLLHELGIKDYESRIFAVEKRTDYYVPGKYITISVDSSTSARRWPAKNFIELIHILLNLYECEIFITGSNVGADENDLYMREFGRDDRVKSKINSLNHMEWIELIRGSRFHIGVDSGSVHVAASVGTPCFCLTGVWDGHRIMPYSISQKTDGTVEPICIYRSDTDPEKLPCYGCCAMKNYGHGNRECSANCKAGKPCLCLSSITVDDVIRSIKSNIGWDGK